MPSGVVLLPLRVRTRCRPIQTRSAVPEDARQVPFARASRAAHQLAHSCHSAQSTLAKGLPRMSESGVHTTGDR